MDMVEDDGPVGMGNSPEFTVSELSGAVKRVIEGEFGRVRVRGEVSRISRPASGHLYFDLKDDRAVIAAVSWKGQVARMSVRPEEGMEIIATGRLTTFPSGSKYQLIVESVEPAGVGALMAMLEKRRKMLAAEGLFDAARKRPIPFLPEVIGVVTSPSGAVIRDILHRLRDRFPRRVLIWPVSVQGEKCAAEVAAAIQGFNALAPGGRLPRPDVIIVARGGGSLEDLWGFNEEIVVRAAAESQIPLISAVGHETDTTLIDYAADLRAPTPTAAAEMAVPVRLELVAWAAEQGARAARALRNRTEMRQQRLRDLARGLGRPGALTASARQRHDLWSERLNPALRGLAARKRNQFGPLSAHVRPDLLRRFLRAEAEKIGSVATRLLPLMQARQRRAEDRLIDWSARLLPALRRTASDALRKNQEARLRLAQLAERLDAAPRNRISGLVEAVERLDRMRQSLGYTETLRRGYAVVRGKEGLVSSRAEAEAAQNLQIEFHDGRMDVSVAGTRPRKTSATPPPPEEPQGSLF